ICRFGHHPLLHESADSHQQHQDWNTMTVYSRNLGHPCDGEAIWRRQVTYPAGEWRVTQLYSALKRLIHSVKDGELDRRRDASAERVDVISLVQVHHLPVEPGRVILEFLPDFLHLRLKPLHPQG